jgi:hypothetical protein
MLTATSAYRHSGNPNLFSLATVSGIRIGYNLPDDVKRHVAIDYEITVPANTAVEGHSESGNVEVTGVTSGARSSLISARGTQTATIPWYPFFWL